MPIATTTDTSGHRYSIPDILADDPNDDMVFDLSWTKALLEDDDDSPPTKTTTNTNSGRGIPGLGVNASSSWDGLPGGGDEGVGRGYVYTDPRTLMNLVQADDDAGSGYVTPTDFCTTPTSASAPSSPQQGSETPSQVRSRSRNSNSKRGKAKPPPGWSADDAQLASGEASSFQPPQQQLQQQQPSSSPSTQVTGLVSQQRPNVDQFQSQSSLSSQMQQMQQQQQQQQQQLQQQQRLQQLQQIQQQQQQQQQLQQLQQQQQQQQMMRKRAQLAGQSPMDYTYPTEQMMLQNRMFPQTVSMNMPGGTTGTSGKTNMYANPSFMHPAAAASFPADQQMRLSSSAFTPYMMSHRGGMSEASYSSVPSRSIDDVVMQQQQQPQPRIHFDTQQQQTLHASFANVPSARHGM
eukprot:c10133_g1_i2.p1 GENE.c10133_g1_i2~~c10133_g1_i2.p1  ORF type:complete len:471 (+),score=134.11 c10133_g1_i2:196-1413(+)